MTTGITAAQLATPLSLEERARLRTVEKFYHDGTHGDTCLTCRLWATVDAEHASALTQRNLNRVGAAVMRQVVQLETYPFAAALWLNEYEDINGEDA